MKKILRFPLIVLFVFSCHTQKEENSVEKWKNEILETEKEFAEMVREKGIPEAFVTYAAEDAVLRRGDDLIMGKAALKKSYENRRSEFEHISLTWKPDFVDVAASGDLGYTYGKYVYTVKDSTGITNSIEGIFHTVWKRQADGTWKFVWD
jgi:ketosteroid isomerase-like protein